MVKWQLILFHHSFRHSKVVAVSKIRLHAIHYQFLLIALLDLLKTLRIVVRQLKICTGCVIAVIVRGFGHTISKVTHSVRRALRVHLDLTLERLRLQPSVIIWWLCRKEVHDAFPSAVAWLMKHFCRGLVRPQVEKHTAISGRMYLRCGSLACNLQVDVLDQLLVAVGGLSSICGDAPSVGPLIFIVILLVELTMKHIKLLLQIHVLFHVSSLFFNKLTL